MIFCQEHLLYRIICHIGMTFILIEIYHTKKKFTVESTENDSDNNCNFKKSTVKTTKNVVTFKLLRNNL